MRQYARPYSLVGWIASLLGSTRPLKGVRERLQDLRMLDTLSALVLDSVPPGEVRLINSINLRFYKVPCSACAVACLSRRVIVTCSTQNGLPVTTAGDMLALIQQAEAGCSSHAMHPTAYQRCTAMAHSGQSRRLCSCRRAVTRSNVTRRCCSCQSP